MYFVSYCNISIGDDSLTSCRAKEIAFYRSSLCISSIVIIHESHLQSKCEYLQYRIADKCPTTHINSKMKIYSRGFTSTVRLYIFHVS